MIFANVMVSMIKNGNWTENKRTECYMTDVIPWESGTEVRRNTLNVRPLLSYYYISTMKISSK